jgi:hypothetical protein
VTTATAVVRYVWKHPSELLARHGYQLYRPGPDGQLGRAGDLGFGADVFARPAAAAAS